MTGRIRIRLLLSDYFNKLTLDVHSDEFGVLCYNLYGTHTKIRFALSNMGAKERLPDLIDNFPDMDALHLAIIAAVRTGHLKVDSTVFAKRLESS